MTELELVSACGLLLAAGDDGTSPGPDAVELFRDTAVVVSVSWIVSKLALTRGVDSFSRKATNASVRLRLLLTLSFDPCENHAPSPADFRPILMHSASLRCNTVEINFRIWFLAVAFGAEMYPITKFLIKSMSAVLRFALLSSSFLRSESLTCWYDLTVTRRRRQNRENWGEFVVFCFQWESSCNRKLEIL